MELIIPTTPAKGEKFGIENLKGWVDFAARLTKHAQEIAADRKISWIEALASLPLLRELFTKIQSFGQLVEELKDLSLEEVSELVDITGQVFNFKPLNAIKAYNGIIVPIFSIGANIYKLIQTPYHLL